MQLNADQILADGCRILYQFTKGRVKAKMSTISQSLLNMTLAVA